MTPASLASVGLTPQQVLDVLYSGIDGYGLANMGRERSGRYGEDFTYGDITLDCAYDMLNAVGAKEGEVFYDLGSGTGKGVLFAALLFDLAKSTGIELVEELHGGSQVALQRYIEQIVPLLPENKRWQTVNFVNADMRTIDWSDADIVYSHCTCFS